MDSGTEKQSQNQRQAGKVPVRRNIAEALSLVALVAGERKPPHVAGMHLTTQRGLILNPNNSRIATKHCHYNTGGCMVPTELGTTFWHDLAAPIIAGILASVTVNWLNKRK